MKRPFKGSELLMRQFVCVHLPVQTLVANDDFKIRPIQSVVVVVIE